MKQTKTSDIEGIRLDAFVSEKFNISRGISAKLIDEGKATLNGNPAKKKTLISIGDRIDVDLPDLGEPRVLPQNIPLDIVYEDSSLLIVNKPKGMVVHPAPGNPDGTLVNALLYHCKGKLSDINGSNRPGIVHRIDKDTSGLLIVAKNNEAHKKLAEQIQAHSFTREYKAVVYGNIKQDIGTIDAPVGRDPKNRKRMAVVYINCKKAITHFEVLQRFAGFSYVKFSLETGRTHQIRVHMANLGHPIAGDTLYGPKKAITSLKGQCLHAGKIGFIHPDSGKYLEFESELPEYFTKFLKGLKSN